MTVALRLDVPAVRALINEDEEFALDLRRSVAAEIVRNVLLKDAAKVLPLLQPAIYAELQQTANENNWLRAALGKELGKLVAKYNGYWGPDPKLKVSNEFQAKVDAALQPLVDSYVKQITDAAAVQLAAAAAKAADGMSELIDRRVARLTEDLINREVDLKFKARLAAIVKEEA